MAQKWHQKVSVQTAIVSGLFLLVGVSIPYFFKVPVLENKIYNLERENTEKSVEIQRLETLLIPFKTIALEKYTGTEQDALKKLAQDIEHLKRVTASRQLTEDQGNNIINILKPFSGSTIKIQRRGEEEAYNFSNKIIEVFRSAGWKVKVSGGRHTMSPPQYGITWWTKDKNAPITQALKAVFKITGEPNLPYFVKDLEYDSAMRVGLKSLN